jgi:hypothetical protein
VATWPPPPPLASDTRASLHQHPLDLQPVVEDDDVRRSADRQATEVVAPDDPRRHRAGRGQGVLELDAELVEVADRLHHGQRASGQRAVVAAHDSALRDDVGAAEREAPVAHARRADRVGHEREPPGRGLPGDEHGLGGEVVAVDDDLHSDVGARQRGHRDPRIPRDARAHRVEEVRHGARAAIEGEVGLGRGGVGVAAGDRDPAGDQLVDELEGAVQLGRQRHLAHRAGIEEAAQQREVGRAAALRVVGAQALGRQEGPFQMSADDPRPAAAGRHRGQRGGQIDLRRSDERRLEGGHAAGEQGLAGPQVPVGVGDLEVDAGEPVGLQVDEARRGDERAARLADPERGDDAVLDLDVAGQQAPVDERGAHAEPHGEASGTRAAASRTLPDAASRACASPASTPASSITSATSRSSPQPARAPRAASSSQPAARQQMRTARSRSFALATRIALMRLP